MHMQGGPYYSMASPIILLLPLLSIGPYYSKGPGNEKGWGWDYSCRYLYYIRNMGALPMNRGQIIL
jgi:hypothetical protein